MDKKKTIYRSLPYTVFLLAVSWGMLIMSVAAREAWASIFFALCAVVNTWSVADPRTQVLFIGTKKYKAHMDKEFEARYNDPGIFTYSNDGFTVALQGRVYSVAWPHIIAIYGYKVDLAVSDTICIDVIYDKYEMFTISESTAGWFVFLREIATQFPSIDPNWHIEISVPAFATNLTLVYEREKDDVIHARYYGDSQEQDTDPDNYPPYKSEGHSSLL